MNADGWAAAPAECRWAVAGCGWVARDHFLPGLLEAADAANAGGGGLRGNGTGGVTGTRGVRGAADANATSAAHAMPDAHGTNGRYGTRGADSTCGPRGTSNANGTSGVRRAADAHGTSGAYGTGTASDAGGATDQRSAGSPGGASGAGGAGRAGSESGSDSSGGAGGSGGSGAAGRPGGPVPRLVAVTDLDPSAAALLAGRAPGARTAAGLADLLTAYRPDAVYVATPNHAHRSAVEAVAAAGAAVLCEKPLAADLAEAERLVAACRRAGTLAATAFDQRFHPAHRAVRDMVARGALGTVTAVRITYCCWLPPAWSPDGRPYDNWRADPARAGGGAALDLAPHGLDLVGVLLGGDDVTELTALVQHRVHPYPVDDGAVLAGRTGGDVLVTLHVAYNTPDTLPRRRLEVVGTFGQLTATDTLGQDAGGTVSHTDTRTGERVPVPFDATTSPFAAQVREFSAAVAAVRAGTPVERAWPWPLERDLALHRLLLDALSRAGAGAHATAPRHAAGPAAAPVLAASTTAEEGRR